MYNSKQYILLIVISISVLLMMVCLIIVNTNTLILKSSMGMTRNSTGYDFSMFKKYKIKFNKSYGAEEEMRFRNFQNSLKEISRMNEKESGEVFGLTKFSDMSKEEFAQTMLMPNLRACRSNDMACEEGQSPTLHKILDSHEPFHMKYDWRDTGKVGPVLDQKMCRGCWAFSVVGVMEVMLAKNRHENHSEALSIQEVLDCAGRSSGCGGGSMISTQEYFCPRHWGIITEDQYPLTLEVESCRVSADVSGIRIKEFASRCRNVTEEAIARAIILHGPVVATVDAASWRNYLSGIIQQNCKNEGILKHVVQIVGYDMTGAVPYYIIKNSWGTDFGEEGYIKLAMFSDLCGIADEIAILDVY